MGGEACGGLSRQGSDRGRKEGRCGGKRERTDGVAAEEVEGLGEAAAGPSGGKGEREGGRQRSPARQVRQSCGREAPERGEESAHERRKAAWAPAALNPPGDRMCLAAQAWCGGKKGWGGPATT